MHGAYSRWGLRFKAPTKPESNYPLDNSSCDHIPDMMPIGRTQSCAGLGDAVMDSHQNKFILDTPNHGTGADTKTAKGTDLLVRLVVDSNGGTLI